MTTEFRIDKPGWYKTRNGNCIAVWPNVNCQHIHYKWLSIGHECGMAYTDTGRRFCTRESPDDIVSYDSPLHHGILQQIREALVIAEEALYSKFEELIKESGLYNRADEQLFHESKSFVPECNNPADWDTIVMLASGGLK